MHQSGDELLRRGTQVSAKLPLTSMKFHSLPRVLAPALVAFAFGLAANAADTTGTVSRGDKSFLENAWKSGTEEIAVSQAALPNLTEVLIQQFAQMMVSDHTPANAELSA